MISITKISTSNIISKYERLSKRLNFHDRCRFYRLLASLRILQDKKKFKEIERRDLEYSLNIICRYILQVKRRKNPKNVSQIVLKNKITRNQLICTKILKIFTKKSITTK